MEVREEKLGNAYKLSVVGRLTADCAEDFKRTVTEVAAVNPKIVLDLSEMEYIDSTGLGALVFSMQKAGDKGGTLKLAALAAKPRIVFDITKAYKVFDIYESVEDALAALDTPKP